MKRILPIFFSWMILLSGAACFNVNDSQTDFGQGNYDESVSGSNGFIADDESGSNDSIEDDSAVDDSVTDDGSDWADIEFPRP